VPPIAQSRKRSSADNNARLYHFTPQQRSALENDRFALLKENYEKTGEGRSNLSYDYIPKRSA